MKKLSIAFVITCLVGCFGAEPQKTGMEGKPLPGFNLLLPDSSTWVNTNQAPKGKPVILYYFNPHCPYCKAQTKEIIEDMDQLKANQFYFITPYPFDEMKKFWKEYELAKYPNISTGIDTSGAMGNYFEVSGVPYLAIYGKDQKLTNTFMGKIYSSQIKKVAEQ
ncbi:TlpA family protein disulfide reductase [Niastella sp. OAS944]|uniref:TlpA family protein disulfide reductase n=1 Tax=Niastella sp. OAS944 TaxID=2664089 RepID=UPI003494D297|nr:thiol-disulfide isomerase/thioredoxin [Chitinophagaceae bacterium OAS944]